MSFRSGKTSASGHACHPSTSCPPSFPLLPGSSPPEPKRHRDGDACFCLRAPVTATPIRAGSRAPELLVLATSRCPSCWFAMASPLILGGRHDWLPLPAAAAIAPPDADQRFGVWRPCSSLLPGWNSFPSCWPFPTHNCTTAMASQSVVSFALWCTVHDREPTVGYTH